MFQPIGRGRLGKSGKRQLKGPHDELKGTAGFWKVFCSKTKNAWGAHPFVRHGGKYQIIKAMIEDDGNNSSAALGWRAMVGLRFGGLHSRDKHFR